MATEASPQRAYRAACPSCGAPVEFRSAASALAVCGFCRSTLLREGEALRRIGVAAELFDDHSPLQLGASGRWQGAGFTLVGRLQIRYAGGSWNEWHALFDGGGAADATPGEPPRSGWLSEDNGGYVFGFEAPPPGPLPPPEALRVGAPQRIGRDAWTVASVTTARLATAEGELPFAPALERAYVVAELRNVQGDVASIDYGAGGGAATRWFVGRGLQLADLQLRGLREGPSEQALAGRQLPCPSCGAPLAVTLASTKSVVCGQCRAVVDVSEGAGADLAQHALNHDAQAAPGAGGIGGEPLIPLGVTGTLALGTGGPLAWQVVGYVERCTIPGPGDDGEVYYWREYLLYQRQAGFAFLVDAEDGWSGVRTITGAPQVSGGSARWQGASYTEKERYRGRITYVLGEFYWKLALGETTSNTDYLGPGGRRLNREETGTGGDAEVVWSAGQAIEADAVLKAFGLGGAQRAAFQRDVKPMAGGGSGSLAGFFMFLLFAMLLFSLVRCGGDECDETKRVYGAASNEYQQCTRGAMVRGGGSYGGFSTGGWHK